MTIVSSGVSIGAGITFTSEPFYTFTTFTFQTGNILGSSGPTATQLFGNTYSNVGNTWLTNSSWYSVTNGIQYWTVPFSGNYQITAAGASPGLIGGGTSYYSAPYYGSGLGAKIRATVQLIQGQTLAIVAGQSTYPSVNAGQFSCQGGAGGSFVVALNTSSSITSSNQYTIIPIVIAGGGGGPGWYNQSGVEYAIGGNAVTSTSGGYSYNLGYNGNGAPGGTNGQGGVSTVNGNGLNTTSGYSGGAGGGLYSTGFNGVNGSSTRSTAGSGNYGGGGGGLLQGASGGQVNPSYATNSSAGGFGGGGGGGAIDGGGGGGYSGGGGSFSNVNRADAGGGGGSYIILSAANIATSDGNYNGSGTFYDGSTITKIGTSGNTAYNFGSGYVTITKVA